MGGKVLSPAIGLWNSHGNFPEFMWNYCEIAVCMELNEAAFIDLFKAACEKCFGYAISSPLSEADSRLLSNKILERTGLMIGVKSIKNYSSHVLKPDEGRKENPSIATMDTFARYVLNAPAIDEIQRKQNEDHHPYWFEYKISYAKSHSSKKTISIKPRFWIAAGLILIVAAVVFLLLSYKRTRDTGIIENFDSVNDSLRLKGWSVKNIEPSFWAKRGERPGHLTLLTLRGDNWPGSKEYLPIRNLLVRNVDADCFIAEINFFDFFPGQNWQQAGILLSEDSTFRQKVVRLSIGYNDFFGGYEKPPEIIIQVVASSENGNQGKPEEIAHVPVFNVAKGMENLVRNNLSRASLRIEKKNQTFRFLYTTSPTEGFAFNEVARRDLGIKPKYIGLFAIQGLSETETPAPVHVNSFALTPIACEE